MSTFICQDACKVNRPCQNGATCVAKNDGYTCLCKPGYQGVNCEQGESKFFPANLTSIDAIAKLFKIWKSSQPYLDLTTSN